MVDKKLYSLYYNEYVQEYAMKVTNKHRRSRAHKILFDRELPFQSKRVSDKTQYSRKAKHPNRILEV